MSFLNHALYLFAIVLAWLALAPVLPVVATNLQEQTFGIDSSAVRFSTGWSTVSNAAGTFSETTGKANEVEIFLPVGTVSLSYVGFKQTGGALYAVCLDCGTSGQQIQQINASDPMADASTAVVLFSYTGLNSATSHTLQVVNGADAAFENTSTLTFKEVDASVVVTSTTSSSTTTSTSSTSSRTTSSTDVSTTTTTSSSSLSTTTTSLLSTTATTSSLSTTTTTETPPLVSITTSSIPASSTATAATGSLTRTSLSTGTIVAAAVSSAAAVLLLLALAIFLLYRARNRQLRADSESVASGMGLTRQISAPSVVAAPFEVSPATAVSSYIPPGPRSATAATFNRQSMANNVRRRSYLTGSVRGAAAVGAVPRDGDTGSTSSVPSRPRNPYEGVVRPDVPLDYPGHLPGTPRTPGSGRQRGVYR